jgi:hypothetical protein
MSFLMMASAAVTAFYAIVKIVGMIQERRKAKGKGPWALKSSSNPPKQKKHFFGRRRP